MEATDLRTQRARCAYVQQRFVVRQNFYKRCIHDIETDFHKQYGPFERDWRATHDACLVFVDQVEKYLVSRDVQLLQCDVFLSRSEQESDREASAQIHEKMQLLLEDVSVQDVACLAEHDQNVENVRSVFSMISLQESYEDL